MIKIQTFPIEKSEEANKFIEKHPPRSTDKQSGLVFHNSTIVIIYDDGKVNALDRTSKIETQLEGDRSKLMLVEQQLKMAEISLKDVKPEGYVTGMSHTKIKSLLEKKNGISSEINADLINSIVTQVTNIENELLMDRHEKRRLGYSIAAWEDMLKESK